MKKSVVTIKNENRDAVVEKFIDILKENFGENAVRVGNSEFSLYVGDSENGEKMFVNVDISSKEFVDRQTTKKFFKAYNGFEESEKYYKAIEEKELKKIEDKKKKEKKIAADKLAREKKRLEKIKELENKVNE